MNVSLIRIRIFVYIRITTINNKIFNDLNFYSTLLPWLYSALFGSILFDLILARSEQYFTFLSTIILTELDLKSKNIELYCRFWEWELLSYSLNTRPTCFMLFYMLNFPINHLENLTEMKYDDGFFVFCFLC